MIRNQGTPPKKKKNSIGKYLGPYIKALDAGLLSQPHPDKFLTTRRPNDGFVILAQGPITSVGVALRVQRTQ